ncbi:hypothetical protein LTR92_006645 [Exophiala xenobiotica]|nr:hypothetical protein LTR92_006645 [Exophiala xenobiotica]
MPPFFPNARNRRPSPTPVDRASDKAVALAKKIPKGSTSKWDNGSIITSFSSQVPTEVPRAHVVPRYTNESLYESKMNHRGPELRGERESGRARARRPPRDPQEPDEMDISMSPMNQLPKVSFLPIYDLVLLLQQRGISVNLTAAAVREASAQGLINRPLGLNTDRVGTDVYNTSTSDIDVINEALTFLLNCGADIDFVSLQREQPTLLFRCNCCSETFMSQREREEHRSGVFRTCEHCNDDSLTFECRTLFDEHMRKVHKMKRASYGTPADTRSEHVYGAGLRV